MSAIAGTFRAVRRMLALCAFICVSVSAAYADAVADFYRDKTITIVIGHPVGGSYDLYARLIARHVGKYIPGNPSVIIQNMPGASALIATNFVVNNPTQDGTLIAAIGSNGPFQPMLESGAVKFDPVNTNWLPSPASMVALLVVWHTAPVEKFEDMKHKELQIATLSPVSIPSFYAAIFNDLFKTKMKLIFGYGGMGNAYLAMERGEIDGFPSTPWDSVKRIYSNLLAQKKIKLMLQYGGAPSPELPHVPFARDLTTSPEDRQLLDLSTGPLKIAYPYLMGPGVPLDRLAAIRSGFMKVFNDPALRAEALKQTLDIDPVSAEEVQSLIKATYDAPKAVQERLRNLYQAQVR